MKSERLQLYPLFAWAAIFAFEGIVLFRTASQQKHIDFMIFLSIFSIWFFVSSIGVFMEKRWGLILLKVNLSIIFFAFPVGTFLSVRTTRYIEKKDIKRFFK